MIADSTCRPLSSQIFRLSFIAASLALLLGLGASVLINRKIVAMADSASDDQVIQGVTATGLIISEFRLRGPNGPNDEFIEIFNRSGSIHTVAAVSGTGYAIAASDGVVRCTIPNGTTISTGGHYLCANGAGYSLAGYPSGNGTTASPDATYSIQIPDNVGIALFNNNSGGASFNLANRFSAVGSTAETNPLYREGLGYPSLSQVNTNHSINAGKTFLIFVSSPTDPPRNNAEDYIFIDPAGTSAGMNPHLGAPGPQNLSSPAFVNGTFEALRLDATKAVSLSPNRVRDFTSDPANNSTFGTLSIRRRIVNHAAVEAQMIRWRIIDTSTLPAAGGDADLRVRSVDSSMLGSVNDSATCAATGSPATPPCTVIVQGTTLQTPPAQPMGGGFNSSLLAGTITLATPLAPGASLDLQFLMGVQQNGNYRLTLALEALPAGGVVFTVTGNTNVPAANSDALNTVADFDGDGKSDLSVFRPSNSVWYELRSQGGFLGVQFGAAGDRIAPADYNGDGKTDVAVYRPPTGAWYIRNSPNNSFTYYLFGIAEDLPAPADYDGDGKADLCLFRPSTGTWYRQFSGNGAINAVRFGVNGDKPTVGDFDGDGKADIALFRPSAGSWYRLNSSDGTFVSTQFGLSTDLTVPADYDGDGKTDIAVYRASIGYWYLLNSSNGAFVASNFGAANDIPTAGDYDGDGRADLSVFRPSDASWYRLNSANGGFFAQQFGATGDRPTPAAFRY